MSAVSDHLLQYICLQSLTISCSMQSLTISCRMSAPLTVCPEDQCSMKICLL
ncbi:unnamed protein product [Staurois parvus]|uniref:Uncharacterized protein n=1 Tax=Staurois parvus TaxID=386267 RepID=A0ABN9GF60_9NEOB|nr:unnamed protein product [Staurois parvus]